jgi:two-component system response regulator (stage 0 sporulation protein F)
MSSDPVILVVDDDINLRELYGLVLLEEGFEVFQAGNGVEALKVLENEKIDLVLSDVRMPKMTGEDLLTRIVERNRFKIPVILISGFSEITRPEAFSIGAYEYLKKPFQLNNIATIVKRSLLPLKDRFSIPLEGVRQNILTGNGDWDLSSKDAKTIQMGRLGFHILGNRNEFPLNSLCDFSILMKSDDVMVEGVGKITWVNDALLINGHVGVGIEILSLSADCCDYYIDRAEELKIVSSIPLIGV